MERASRTGRSRVLASDSSGVSEIVGTILLISITVATAAAFALLLATFSAPMDRTHAVLVLSVDKGADGVWGSGDELVNVTHRGGEALRENATQLVIRIDDNETRIDGIDLAGGGSGGRLSIGTTWTATVTIPAGAVVDVAVVVTDQEGAHVVASAAFDSILLPMFALRRGQVVTVSA